MKLNKLTFLSLAIASLFFLNCSKESDSKVTDAQNKFNLGKSVSRVFKGTIVDGSKSPLSGVTVRLNDKVATTDINGIFTFSNATVLERFAYFTATKTGFVNGSRTVMTHEGLNSLEIMMLPETVVATIPSGVSKIVTLPNGVKVTFDGSFSKENGTQYNGNVSVIMNHLDSADENVFMKMPGTLLALNAEGEFKGLETYGMINVELRGAANEKLQLTVGHKAKLELPIAANQLDTAPARIPLWHFDEVTGLWKEEGFSTRSNNVYKGEVSHFSWWNNDDAFVVGTLNVLVTSGGSPVNGVRVTITRQNGSTGDVLMNLGNTNSNGMLSSPVPLNEPYTFRAYSNGEEIYSEVILASNQLIRNITIEMGVDTRPGN